MAQVLKLNTTTIKQPTKFRIGNFKLTRETGRLINGEMVMDYVSLKKKFYFEYDAINGADLRTILAIIDTSTIFFTFTYKDREGTHSVTVYAGAIDQGQFRTDGSWVWDDVRFDLIER